MPRDRGLLYECDQCGDREMVTDFFMDPRSTPLPAGWYAVEREKDPEPLTDSTTRADVSGYPNPEDWFFCSTDCLATWSGARFRSALDAM